ncbi:hypothetical protein ACFVWG_14415 [Kribbella sp. NPDC058245]|uniref:hypothetical protein n=1 Tax=Kribbella sp. NPDC058245 TaxID=3346399 RepID=UPI0036E2F3D1
MGEIVDQHREVRRCAQEIIAAHVVARDLKLRDRLIDEYLDDHGDDMVNTVCGFINHHLSHVVNRELAEACYFAMSSTLGDLIDMVSELSGCPVAEIISELVEVVYVPEDGTEQDARQANLGLAAAQTCLIAHVVVRAGGQPWGIQKNLDLDDMCAVVHQFGALLYVVANRPGVPAAALVKGLLAHVERILVAHASANLLPVSEYVAKTWQALALSDVR